MAKRNGFFRLQIEDNGIYLQLFPPVEGGDPVQISEVMDYLNRIKISDYNLNLLNQTLHNLQKPVSIKLSNEPCANVSEMSKVQISPDRMIATIRLYPPSNRGKRFTRENLIGELTHVNIRFGILEKVVQILVETPVYCHDIIIARGKPAVEGSDARIEYHFDTHPLSKPTLNEDGTVDFHQLNIFTPVTKDQLLATLTPEQPGEDGIDVMGNRVPPKKVHKAMLKCGKNIRFSEDHLQMFSEVNGDVKLEGDTVFVSGAYTVPADVDTSTGDIVYEGDVIVNGNVRTGFRIQAKGDIQVKGVVEGADLYAGGNIVLSRGIQGMNRGHLEANGDIVTRFIESANVKAGGTVRSGSILHSKVEAGDTILCEGRKSFAIGGSLSALNQIEVKTIGNQMGTITTIKLGVDAAVLEEQKALQKEYEENSAAIDKYMQILLLFKKRLSEGQTIPPDKVALVRATSEEKKQLEARQEELKVRIEEVRTMIEANTRGRLKVSDTIYPGVQIQIANSQYVVKNEQRYCQFCLRDGEIVADGY